MDRKKNKSDHRHSKHDIVTETDLMLHLLADKSKLKPIEKTINVIQVDDEETALEAGLKRKTHDDDISFDGSESVSIKSGSSSSSSHRQKHHISSKSHSKLDKIIEEYKGHDVLTVMSVFNLAVEYAGNGGYYETLLLFDKIITIVKESIHV